MSKNVYIIAGANGSGKTTFARKFLPDYVNCPNFINADLIALGLAPFGAGNVAIKAGKLVLEQIRSYSKRGIDFSFETTLSGQLYVNLLKKLRAKGYRSHLFFLWLPNPELAVFRVKDRVAEGGHNVPVEDIRRRFHRGIENLFNLYMPLLDTWTLFDNSGVKPVLIARNKNGDKEIINKELFDMVRGCVRK
ncbi:MAG: zeta toxin family protein [Pseudomonadota bacterium]